MTEAVKQAGEELCSQVARALDRGLEVTLYVSGYPFGFPIRGVIPEYAGPVYGFITALGEEAFVAAHAVAMVTTKEPLAIDEHQPLRN